MFYHSAQGWQFGRLKKLLVATPELFVVESPFHLRVTLIQSALKAGKLFIETKLLNGIVMEISSSSSGLGSEVSLSPGTLSLHSMKSLFQDASLGMVSFITFC